MSLDAPTVAVLNDKNKFSTWAAGKGLRVPKSFAVTSKEQLLDLNPRCDALLPAQRRFDSRRTTALGGRRYQARARHLMSVHRGHEPLRRHCAGWRRARACGSSSKACITHP